MGKTEFILGYAIWTFHGVDAPATAVTSILSSLANSIERTLLRLEDLYTTHFLPVPLIFNQTLRLAFSSVRRPFPAIYPHVTPFIQLDNLGCAPWAQRRGVGARLMAWGLDIARRSEMVCELTASVVGQGLYSKSGFLVVDWPEMAAGEGGASMVFDPTLRESLASDEEGGTKQGRWLVREPGLEVERWGRKRPVEARLKSREEVERMSERELR